MAALFHTKAAIARFIDVDRIQKAIEQAELRTSGEIRVSVAPFFWGSVERAARRAFHRLGMTRTRQRNGILFFVVPSRHAFVVLGDVGVHERVGQRFWEDVVATMTPYFRRGDFTEGAVAGVSQAGAELARHFPHDAGRDVDELPDRVDVPREP